VSSTTIQSPTTRLLTFYNGDTMVESKQSSTTLAPGVSQLVYTISSFSSPNPALEVFANYQGTITVANVTDTSTSITYSAQFDAQNNVLRLTARELVMTDFEEYQMPHMIQLFH